MSSDRVAAGRMVIVTAPSGAGKTTIVHHLLERFPELAFSVSATTRKRRAHEVDGRDYYFLSPADFDRRVEAGDFVEYEEVYPGSRYGTLRAEVERLWKEGRPVVFDVDVKGALALQRTWPERSLSIFVQPPSVEALEERLRKRRTEDDASFTRRMDRARHELGFADRFDHRLVNDDLDDALEEVIRIVGAYLHKGRVPNASGGAT